MFVPRIILVQVGQTFERYGSLCSSFDDFLHPRTSKLSTPSHVRRFHKPRKVTQEIFFNCAIIARAPHSLLLPGSQGLDGISQATFRRGFGVEPSR